MAVVINGSGTVTGLAVGGLPDGTVDAGTLATDSVTAAKLEASAITATDLPSGSVIQVVQGTGFALWSTTSSTFSTTGVTAAITPSSASNKVLVTVSIMFAFSGSTRPRGGFRLHRDDDTIVAGMSDEGFHVHSLGSNGEYRAHMSLNYLDSPNSTSSQDYWIEGRSNGSNPTHIEAGASGTWINNTTITLMEIAG